MGKWGIVIQNSLAIMVGSFVLGIISFFLRDIVLSFFKKPKI